MNNQDIIAHCKEQITVAFHALRTPYETVKSLFQHKEITTINNSTTTSKDKILEIRIGNATLNCLFNQKNICDTVILFFDNSNDIFHYIEYCYQTYKYHYKLHSWICKDYYIKVYTENDEAALFFHI